MVNTNSDPIITEPKLDKYKQQYVKATVANNGILPKSTTAYSIIFDVKHVTFTDIKSESSDAIEIPLTFKKFTVRLARKYKKFGANSGAPRILENVIEIGFRNMESRNDALNHPTVFHGHKFIPLPPGDPKLLILGINITNISAVDEVGEGPELEKKLMDLFSKYGEVISASHHWLDFDTPDIYSHEASIKLFPSPDVIKDLNIIPSEMELGGFPFFISLDKSLMSVA